jgi:hypothetical protein
VECISTTKSIGDSITIDMGYTDEHGEVFTGYIKSIDKKTPDGTFSITAHDTLVRAVDFFIASSTADSPYKWRNIEAGDFIKDILEMAGLNSFDFDDSSFTLAIGVDAEVNLIGAYDYCKSIADLVAYSLWADIDGVVHFKNRKPYVMDGDPIQETQQPGYHDDVSIGTLAYSSIISYNLNKNEKDLRNKIVVYGHNNVSADASSSTSYDPVTKTTYAVLPS